MTVERGRDLCSHDESPRACGSWLVCRFYTVLTWFMVPGMLSCLVNRSGDSSSHHCIQGLKMSEQQHYANILFLDLLVSISSGPS